MSVVDMRRERQPIFRVLGPPEIYATLPTEEHLVGGLLHRSSLLLLGGYGSSGKTWMATDLLCSVGLGTRWMGRMQCQAGRALFIDYESGERELRRRIQALTFARGLPRIEGVHISCMPNGYFGDRRFEDELARLASEFDIIIMDSLKAASPRADENDASMRAGLDLCRRMGELHSCAFVVLVHSKKNGKEGDEREQLRGSSAIFDAADSVLVSTWSKAEERFELVQTKARQGKALDPFTVQIRDTDRGVELIGEDAQEAPRTESMEATIVKVREAIRRQPDMGTVMLRAVVGGNRTRIDGALEYLLNRGEVKDFGVGHAHKFRVFEPA